MTEPQKPEAPAANVVLIVPERHVKAVKSALENFGHLDRQNKITPVSPDDERIQLPQNETAPHAPRFPVLKFDPVSGRYVDPVELATGSKDGADLTEQKMRIPTTIPYTLKAGELDDSVREQHDSELRFKILDDLVLSHLFHDVRLTYQVLKPGEAASTPNRNPVHRALKEALSQLPDNAISIASLGLSVDLLVSSFPESYSVYKPLLLLPHNVFAAQPWQKLLSVHQAYSDHLRPVWGKLAEAVGATHVAINAPIPRHSNTTPGSQNETTQQNTLRSPINLGPLYGDFGPWPTAQTLSAPTQSDFSSQLWVTTTQNGIHQTWAPRFTMFSRGNFGEKTRILNLPSVTNDSVSPSAAADFYAGIGYFAFSYKKGGGGIKRVLCWELNPWSVEGLKRGAALNGWSCTIFTADDVAEGNEAAFWTKLSQAKDADFWVFQMSNEYAERVVQLLSKEEEQQLNLPIRHVNLGLLPTSKPSWQAAARVLSTQHGGWIHVHENVGAQDIDARAKEVESTFQALLGGGEMRKATVEHVEKVKTYAPGVVHVVFDVHVTGVQ